MASSSRKSLWLAPWLASAMLPCLAPSAAGQEFFESGRDFVIDRPCDATASIRTRAQPAPLEVGTTYTGRGLNRKANPSHVFVRVGEANRWVEFGCGHFADGAGPLALPADGAALQKACLPFFDTVDNPETVGFGGFVDVSPPPPSLDEFDRAIVAACGAPGKEVPRAEFVALLKAHPDVLARIVAFASGKVYAGRPEPASVDAYVEDLADAWYAISGFDHIFCGEPSNADSGGQVGGLHFRARYLELQNSGDACRMNNFRQNEVVPGVIYTMGLRMRNARGRMVPDARKGYGLTLSGEDLFKVVTRAFADNPTDHSDSTACLVDVGDEGKRFTAVFVRRATGIRTFYPDATPNGGGTPNPACSQPIELKD